MKMLNFGGDVNDFSVKTASLVQNQAVMEATRETEMKLQEANAELAMLRESQQDAVPPAQPKCCVIM